MIVSPGTLTADFWILLFSVEAGDWNSYVSALAPVS
jgi:hypothetical protein